MRSCATFNKVSKLYLYTNGDNGDASADISTPTNFRSFGDTQRAMGGGVGAGCGRENVEKVKLSQHDKCITISIAIICIGVRQMHENDFHALPGVGVGVPPTEDECASAVCSTFGIVIAFAGRAVCEQYNLIIMNEYALKQTIN